MATGTSLCFERILSSFKSHLGPKLAADFQTTSLDDLRRCIAKIERKQATQKRMQDMGRLSTFVTIMDNYSKVIEVFINAADILAFVWGPIKFLLQVASSVSEAFNELLATYKMIGNCLPHIETCQGILLKYPCLEQALESMFHDIFEFHQAALLYFRKPMWKQIFQATWSTYKTKFGPIVNSLKSHKQLFGERLTFTQLEEIRSTAAQSAKNLENLMKGQMMGQLREVQCWLNGADVATDQDTLRLARSGNPRSGSWLLKHTLFSSWKDTTEKPILWVNGIPGAGKTVLASIMIDECLTDYSKHTIWFYFKSGNAQRGSFLSFACSLISQVLEKNTDLLPYIYECMCRKGKKTLFSEALAKELLEIAIRNSGNLCIIIDGLDECSRSERRKVIEWMHSVIDVSQRSSSNRIRCIYVSQRDAVTTRALKGITSFEIGTKDTHDDISAYVSSRAVEIQNKFRMSDETRRGMFLLAKLVMSNLFSQVSPNALLNALHAERIPTQLEEAYDRILKSILEDQSSRMYALQLLAWLVCAKRQLQWREIQGAVSIDLKDEDVDTLSRRWILDSRDLCDSLVERRTDGSLELVHETAKLFLLQTKTVDVPREDLSMAYLCVGYLALPGFQTCLPDGTIVDLIKSGYYAFADYAVCFWSHHLRDGLKDDTEQATVNSLLEVLSRFLESHYRAPETDFDIPIFAREIEGRLQMHEVWSDCDKLLRALVSTKKQLSSFNSDAASNDCLNISSVVARIRQLLEQTVLENKVDSEMLKSFYGDSPFKCPRISCDYFYQGFQTAEIRDSHMNKHNRPYGCSFPQCYRSTIRFSSKKLLERHIADTHEGQKRDVLAFPPKRAKLSLVCRFCKKEFHETKLYRKHDCTRQPTVSMEKSLTATVSESAATNSTTGELSSHSKRSDLIRTDQVHKLPHLNEAQKAELTQVVQKFWQTLDNDDEQSSEYQTALLKLTQLSQNFMEGMRLFQHRQQTLQQQNELQQQSSTAHSDQSEQQDSFQKQQSPSFGSTSPAYSPLLSGHEQASPKTPGLSPTSPTYSPPSPPAYSPSFSGHGKASPKPPGLSPTSPTYSPPSPPAYSPSLSGHRQESPKPPGVSPTSPMYSPPSPQFGFSGSGDTSGDILWDDRIGGNGTSAQ
ncbi:ankyrin repeat-containing protein [Penicillium frequentans]|uniref:Ankyrin repeat-containing protein n=1 Tax=Penicillium frequentans TaxID=3151616 RepID=A0AAD6CTJ1_9EURO|nr:ankyrin repeat-containing protein [Penicillium glabrum]